MQYRPASYDFFSLVRFSTNIIISCDIICDIICECYS